MGGHRDRAEPTGFLANGLLPNEAARVTRGLDQERWSRAEARTAELLGCIQPSPPSEERRQAVVSYVQLLIMKCLPCQVFSFGSVPLKTYLPDGDIDLTAFSENQNLKETWANEVRDMLEHEEKSEDAEFRVRDVQYIQADVKIIKCLVENIVVDISFNQLGGLGTLFFLEKLDRLIDSNHLFKRSIILIKAWCYYESRILGAHHGLISTYALETLVLYIFHVFDGSFAGPLEVLYRFLEFFSKFDWDNYCVSLWGPVPINSLPGMAAYPPRKDDRELKLSILFSDECSSMHGLSPASQETQDLPFNSKYLNIVDPLLTSNNLGRSVSKGNFFRIRSAFAFGAQQLARLLHCPEENVIHELNQFFMNTWDRHGKGLRPDAPSPDARGLRSGNFNQDVSSQHGNKSVRQTPMNSTASATGSHAQVQKTYAKSIKSMASDQSNESLQSNNIRMKQDTDKNRSSRSDMRNEVHARHFARTHSSPELSPKSSDVQVRRGKASETGNVQTALPRLNNSSRKTSGADILDNNSDRFSVAFSSSSRQSLSDQSIDADADSGFKNHVNSGLVTMGEEHQYVDEAMHMHREHQDFMNRTLSRGYNFNGQVRMPFNYNPAHASFPIPPSMFVPLGYDQGLIPFSAPQHPSSVGMTINGELNDMANSHSGSMGLKLEHNEHVVWPIQDADSVRGYDHNNRTSQSHLLEDTRDFNSRESNSVCPSNKSSSGGSSLKGSGFNRENRVVSNESCSGNFHHQRMKSAPFVDSNVVHALNENGWKYEDNSTVDAAGQENDDIRDWNPHPTVGTDGAQGTMSESVPSSPVQAHQLTGYEPPLSTRSNSIHPVDQMLEGPPKSQQSANDSNGTLPFTFYPTGPPVPFFTMIPVYNLPRELPIPGVSRHHSDREGFNNHHKSQVEHMGDSVENLCQSENLDASQSGKSSEEQKSDILSGDFTSHWQNLHYGRFCQNDRQWKVYYPSPLMPPMPLDEHLPWDGPRRPPAANMNLPQYMSYPQHLIPVSSVQSSSGNLNGVYQHNAEEIPRYRGGTGTYLPNLNGSSWDRPSSNTRNHRGNWGHDRTDQRVEREGNWNMNTKPRFVGRGGRNQFDQKPSMRGKRGTSSNYRINNRPWDSSRHDSVPSYYSHNGPSNFSNYMNNGSTSNMGYGMHPLPVMNPNGVSSSGPMIMWYRYDHSMAYGPPAEHQEFGSVGPSHFPGADEVSHISEGSSGGINEEQDFLGDSGYSSPFEPSSPRPQR